jgi:transcriptional regulator with XRE-family HTH domain
MPEQDLVHPGIAATTPVIAGADPVTDRRREVGEFLRSRRAKLQPADVGLAPGTRRRTPGLRREEVAHLARVGTTWYTWLEQGRDVNPSPQVLDGVARALRLNTAERRYLYALTRGEEPLPSAEGGEVVPVHLRRVIEHIEPLPAYVTGRRWDLLAWNRPAAALFSNFGSQPEGSANLISWVFVDPYSRRLFVKWEETARGLLAALRESVGRHAGDPAFDELISSLRAESPTFRSWWPPHEVGLRDKDPQVLDHPVVGRLVLDLATFDLTNNPDLKFTFYSPNAEDDTIEKLHALIAGLDESGRS